MTARHSCLDAQGHQPRGDELFVEVGVNFNTNVAHSSFLFLQAGICISKT